MATITQDQLDLYKSVYPNDARIQALTLDEIVRNTHGMSVDWNTTLGTPQAAGIPLTDCQLAIGYVVFDVISLAFGAVGLRAGVKSGTIQAVAGAAGPALNQIEVAVAKIAATGATLTDKAKGVFTILQTIYNAGCLGAVFSAFIGSLNWWQAALYGVTGIATLVAAVTTDGAAFVAEVVVMLATFGFLVTDAVNAVNTCGKSVATAPSEAADEAETTATATTTAGVEYSSGGPVAAIKTFTGNYLTVVNDGGLGGGNVAIQTNRTVVGPWEKFTVHLIDKVSSTFALVTCNGNYVTAVKGGGMGGPNDASSPIHTDATAIGPWEQLTVEEQIDGTYALATSQGFYLTAVNGGGFGTPANTQPIHTNATAIGPWETFTLVPISS
jgi:hypothetical protein